MCNQAHLIKILKCLFCMLIFYFPTWQKENLIIQPFCNVIKKFKAWNTQPPRNTAGRYHVTAANTAAQHSHLPHSDQSLGSACAALSQIISAVQILWFSHFSTLRLQSQACSRLSVYHFPYDWWLIFSPKSQIKNRNSITWLHTAVHMITAKLVSSRPQNN